MKAIAWPADRVSVNISTVFAGMPLLDRPSAAAEAGYEAIESWWPFGSGELEPRIVDAFVESVRRSGVRVAVLNLPSGDGRLGERGLPAVPGGLGRLQASVPAALEIAARLGCTTMNLLYGNADSLSSAPAQFERGAEATAWVVGAAAERGIRIMVEPLCRADAPSYLLRTVDDVRKLRDRVAAIAGVPLGLCFDAYHLYQEDPGALAHLGGFAEVICHVQFSDYPGRSEPGAGVIDLSSVLEQLRVAGYAGYVGLEYFTARQAS